MPKIEELEGKIRKVVETITALRRENVQLRTECESLKSHVTMLTNENHKAQKAIADYDVLRRKQDQVSQRVERALASLNTLRSAS